MANKGPNNGMAIEDYGLVRVQKPCDLDELVIMSAFLDKPTFDWRSYGILLPQIRRGDIEEGLEINTYAISLSEQAYVTIFVKLTSGEEIGSRRLIEMQYRDMIVDNVRAAGGDMGQLRFLGVVMILNEAARASIRRVFNSVGKNFWSRGTVEVTPGDNPREFRECLMNNPFARGQQMMMKRWAGETGGAFIESFVFVSEGYDGPPGDEIEAPYGQPRLHMITRLARPTR
ncbi:hypothetical protein SLS62_009154 [Diatrype stigma]|uniref:Uncharacterized protein n=1 Tax=Diatrype stigma TaxID=117547 RepID=A0AAN9YLH5_9PEZI